MLTNFIYINISQVESGLIDQGHHNGKAHIALSETVQLSIAVNSTMKLLEAAGIKDETLVIVTSDHSHTLTISGYPDIGSNILGKYDRTFHISSYWSFTVT